MNNHSLWVYTILLMHNHMTSNTGDHDKEVVVFIIAANNN